MRAETCVRHSGAVQVVRHCAGRARWLARWSRRHRRWCGLWLVLGCLAWLAGGASVGMQVLAVGLLPALVCCGWAWVFPASYERVCAGPARRLGWWCHCRRRWAAIAQTCGLTAREPVPVRREGKRTVDYRTVRPRLRRVRTRGHLLELTIRARAGQTVEDLDTAAPRIASTLSAVAHRTRPVTGAGSGSVTVVELVMADALTSAVTADEPAPVVACEDVRLGRAQAGGEWWLQLRGRHTLVAGCSGAGKGSVLWGICCGLAPSVRADAVRLWGIDLKRGVELAMGAPLFSAHAYTPDEALEVLRALMGVIDERGHRMAGATRLHQPMVGDPLHVLVIDELAALTAYADLEVRRGANRLLAEILTQGRALGVVVVACVQDPRKDVVGMRGLFTQTVALRLRSSEETVMVLGDGMTRVAPAHRISPSHPGVGWVVEDTGAADRVRADYWPDDLIREVSTRYATEEHVDLTPPPQPAAAPTASAAETGHDWRLAGVDSGGADTYTGKAPRRKRSPRKPRPSAPASSLSAASSASAAESIAEGPAGAA